MSIKHIEETVASTNGKLHDLQNLAVTFLGTAAKVSEDNGRGLLLTCCLASID